MAEEISDQTSRRICEHMTMDHASSVTAMVLESLGTSEKISDCKMTRITLASCTLSYVACMGKECQLHTIEYPFDPPMKSVAEARPRLVAIHHRVMRPKWSWLVTDPISLGVIFAIVPLAMVAYYWGVDGTAEMIEKAPRLNRTVTAVAGSAKLFAIWLRAAWYVTLVAHLAEAGFAAFHCVKTLKLKPLATVEWWITIFISGIAVMNRFLPLVEAQVGAKKAK